MVRVMIISQHLVAMAATAVILGGGIKVIVDRVPCVVVEESTLLTPVVEPGGVLIGQIRLDRNRACHYRRTSWIVDGARQYLPYDDLELAVSGEVLSNDVVVFSERIPVGATPGTAHYYRYGEYSYSALHLIAPLPPVQLANFTFTITEAPEDRRMREILRLLGEIAPEAAP